MRRGGILASATSLEEIFKVEESNKVLLFSIKPKFSELIRAGVKTVELRKKKPKLVSGFALIYESSPKKTISFLVKIKKIDCAPKGIVWKKYRKKCGITKKYFFDYYRGNRQGVAILIDRVIPLKKIISRERLMRCNLAPPQDYRYATTELLHNLMKSV